MEGLRIVPQDFDLHPIRQDARRRIVRAVNIVAETVGIIHDIHSVWLNDHNKGGWAAIMGGVQIGIDEPIDYLRHVPDADCSLIIGLANNDLFKLLLSIRQGARRHGDVANI